MRLASTSIRYAVVAVALIPTACAPTRRDAVDAGGVSSRLRIEVGYSAGLVPGPLTGRLFLGLSPSADPEPRIAAYNSARQRDGRVPFFATDVADVEPDETMVIDAGADGYPYARLDAVAAGRLLDSGAGPCLHGVPPPGRPRHPGAAGPVGGPALGVLPGEPDQRTATRSRGSGLGHADPTGTDGRDSAHRDAAGHRVGQARQDTEPKSSATGGDTPCISAPWSCCRAVTTRIPRCATRWCSRPTTSSWIPPSASRPSRRREGRSSSRR